jgi:alpha-tubulin suppressor-like RCC1 family protein
MIREMRRGALAVMVIASCGRIGFEPAVAPDTGAPPCEPAVDVVALAAGRDTTCAQLGDRTLRCWGNGASGQLGTGMPTSEPDPVAPSGLGAVDAFAVGVSHMCAVAGGVVACWGNNWRGQLGVGDRVLRTLPAVVAGLPSDVVGVAAGGMNSCAWSASELWCWGDRNGTASSNSQTPRQVVLPPVTAVTLGNTRQRGSSAHGCALAGDGTAWCWGSNNDGQLGDGSGVTSQLPVAVAGSARFAALAAGGHHACGRTADGELWCWGANELGQLGDASLLPKLVPVRIALAPVVEIAAASSHTCALTAAGELWCWGDNRYGQIGLEVASATTPTRVAVPPLRTVALGDEHGCGLGVDGVVWCWGTRRVEASQPHAVSVVELGATDELRAKGDVTCARRGDGTAACWGYGRSGQLGDGTLSSRPTPGVVGLPAEASQLALGFHVGCARLADASVACWGRNDSGEVAPGAPALVVTPIIVPGLPPIERVAAGSRHSCAQTATATTWCWGGNNEGQLARITGNGPPAESLFPADGAAIAAGRNHTCVRTTVGALWCAGRNNEGQIGRDDVTGDVYDPVEVFAVPDATDVALGVSHSCAIGSSGTMCWGSNVGGQLGDGTIIDRATPAVVAVPGAVELAAGAWHTCARDAGGTVRCWGDNASGQLGDGTRTSQLTPVIASELAGAVQLAVGNSHSCARLADGTVRCVGSHSLGQLGDGTPPPSAAPTPAKLTCP